MVANDGATAQAMWSQDLISFFGEICLNIAFAANSRFIERFFLQLHQYEMLFTVNYEGKKILFQYTSVNIL